MATQPATSLFGSDDDKQSLAQLKSQMSFMGAHPGVLTSNPDAPLFYNNQPPVNYNRLYPDQRGGAPMMPVQPQQNNPFNALGLDGSQLKFNKINNINDFVTGNPNMPTWNRLNTMWGAQAQAANPSTPAAPVAAPVAPVAPSVPSTVLGPTTTPPIPIADPGVIQNSGLGNPLTNNFSSGAPPKVPGAGTPDTSAIQGWDQISKALGLTPDSPPDTHARMLDSFHQTAQKYLTDWYTQQRSTLGASLG